MPIKLKTGGPDPTMAGRGNAAAQLIIELREPLTAASNYVGTARTILCSGGTLQTEAVVRKLDKVSEQILRAGELLNQLRGQLCDDAADFADGRP